MRIAEGFERSTRDAVLARWRNIGRPGDARLQVLVATVNGISAGIQNTG